MDNPLSPGSFSEGLPGGSGPAPGNAGGRHGEPGREQDGVRPQDGGGGDGRGRGRGGGGDRWPLVSPKEQVGPILQPPFSRGPLLPHRAEPPGEAKDPGAAAADRPDAVPGDTASGPSRRSLDLLPLGTGLTLLGLGAAVLGVRMRRST